MESPTTGNRSASRRRKKPDEGERGGKLPEPWNLDEKYTVLLLGKSGAGKSTLGNDLLNLGVGEDNYKEFFPEGEGSKACTKKVTCCTSTDGMLTIIDTPGIPDPTPANTVKYLVDISKEFRRVEWINLLVFVAYEDNGTNPAQLAQYRLLLKQLKRLPCAKLMVCRQPANSPRQSDEARKKKRDAGLEFVRSILKDSEVFMPCILHVDGDSDDAQESLALISTYTRSFPRKNVADPSNRPSQAELKRITSSLASKAKRVKTLKAEVEAMEAELWELVST